MSKPINVLLSTLFKQEEHTWKFQLLQQWQEILGKLSSVVVLEKIEQTTLILGVADSCWLQELYLMSPLLLKTINAKLENAPIQQLRFKLSGITKKKHLEKKDTKPFISYKQPELRSCEHQALEKIDDPELRLALKQFLLRCYREK